MEIRKIISALAILLIGISAFSQGPHKNMFRSMGTFALGVNGQEVKYYVTGEFGFMLTDVTELNGAVAINVGSSIKDASWISRSAIDDGATCTDCLQDYYFHSVFWGPKFHLNGDKALDLYVGVQPGIGFLTFPDYSTPSIFPSVPREFGVTPLASGLAGIAWYGSFFHAFAQLRGVAGGYSSQHQFVKLSELRPSFGLGFNIN